MRKLAIIPARSGSKGIKDKNIKILNGRPLMAYTIEAAVESKLFDEVMVSTDSSEYAEIAKQYGANIPFLRSLSNSNDRADSWDVVREVLAMYETQGLYFDVVALLQPTSPLRDCEDILSAFNIFMEKSASAVISVCEAEHPVSWYNVLPPDGSLDGFISCENNCQRQKLEKYYRPNGAIYFVKVNIIKEKLDIYQKGSYAYIMSREKSVDIDMELDFLYAELIKKYN